MSDHENKTLKENGEVIKKWRGECEVDICGCQMYEFNHIYVGQQSSSTYGGEQFATIDK